MKTPMGVASTEIGSPLSYRAMLSKRPRGLIELGDFEVKGFEQISAGIQVTENCVGSG
jgi:hypothetical protein